MHLSAFHFVINMNNNVSTDVMIQDHPIFGWIWVVPLPISATVCPGHQNITLGDSKQLTKMYIEHVMHGRMKQNLYIISLL